MERAIANILSVVFQPVFVPLYSVILIFNSGSHLSYAIAPSAKVFIYLVISLNLMILPIAMLVYFKKKGLISSYHIRDSKERLFPFLATLVFHASTYFLFVEMELPTLIPNMILGGAVSIAFAMAVNTVWKISIHLMGMGSIVGLLIGLTFRYDTQLFNAILVFILISGLVGFARLRLDAHTSGQVYAGFLSGTLIMATTVLLG